MGSPNAFATSALPTRHSNVLTEQDHNARSPKRVRLSEDAVASIHTQCAHTDTSLEVDHMVLDYIAYNAIKSCLASRNLGGAHNPQPALSSQLAMFNAFLSIFTARHPTYKPDAELRLRILLLKLTALFTQRLTSNPTTPPRSTLLALRSANDERARAWIGSFGGLPSLDFDITAFDNELPVPLQHLERNRANVLYQLGIPAEDEDYEDAFYGTSSCVALLDILPLFMEMSAARNALSGSNLTLRWMELACDFMLQACVEQYLVIGSHGSDGADEAFAWGYLDVVDDAMDIDGAEVKATDNKTEVNAMFEDEDYATELEGWTSLKTEYIQQLFPSGEKSPARTSRDNENPNAGRIVAHLETVAAAHPIASFESSLLKFFEAISKSIPDPVLIQLEHGKLNGMTEQETQAFLTECGVGVAKFFDAPVGFKGVAE